MAEDELCQYLRGLNAAGLNRALNTPELGSRILFHTSWCAACARRVGPLLDEFTERAAEEYNSLDEPAKSRATAAGGRGAI